MTDILLVLVVAALFWKPVWAQYRLLTTRKGPDKRAEYEKRKLDWYEGLVKVIF